MRDAAFERTRKSTAAFNNYYEFDFQALVDRRARADRSYVIHITVRSRTSQVLPPPAPGTRRLHLELGSLYPYTSPATRYRPILLAV